MERKTATPTFVEPLRLDITSDAETAWDFAAELASYAEHQRHNIAVRMASADHRRRSELEKQANVWREVVALCRVTRFTKRPDPLREFADRIEREPNGFELASNPKGFEP
jgi:hypothetical protein